MSASLNPIKPNLLALYAEPFANASLPARLPMLMTQEWTARCRCGNFSRDALAISSVARGNHDVAARFRQCFGDRATDTLGRAGYDGGLVFHAGDSRFCPWICKAKPLWSRGAHVA